MGSSFLPYGRQTVTEDDIAAVQAVLRSPWLTQGPAVPAFEKALSDFMDVPHAVAVNSATSALHIACLALGLGPGDRLWTSPISFVASSNCGIYCGASVDFVDVCARSANMCPDGLAQKLADADKAGELPKVLVVVHLAGVSADMEPIAKLCAQYGVRIIEDASHAIGARHRNDRVGACAHSDITVFSFHPVKIITTGEGGIATTNDDSIALAMRRLASHGITKTPDEFDFDSDGGWYYEQQSLGFNYRITDIQSALGRSQLKRLDRIITRRNEIADIYDAAFAGTGITGQWRDPADIASLHLYVVRTEDDGVPDRRNRLYNALREGGVAANLHYIPIYRQPYYREMGFEFADFPNAKSYYRTAVSIPMHPTLPAEDQQHVIDIVLGSCDPA